MFSTSRWFLPQLVCVLLISVTSAWLPPTNSHQSFVTNINLPVGYVNHPTVNAAYKVHTNRLNWAEAKEACIAEGGRLAVADNAEKIRYIKEQGSSSADLWLGISKNGGRWVAVDNSSREVHVSWGWGEPMMSGDCIILKSANRGLGNTQCSWHQSFACEILTTVHPTPNLLYPNLNAELRPYQLHGNYSHNNWNGNYSLSNNWDQAHNYNWHGKQSSHNSRDNNNLNYPQRNWNANHSPTNNWNPAQGNNWNANHFPNNNRNQSQGNNWNANHSPNNNLNHPQDNSWNANHSPTNNWNPAQGNNWNANHFPNNNGNHSQGNGWNVNHSPTNTWNQAQSNNWDANHSPNKPLNHTQGINWNANHSPTNTWNGNYSRNNY